MPNSGLVVCTLGDLLLDVIARVEQPFSERSESNSETRVGAGGQAAKVAAWARKLGAEARFIGKRASDAPGEQAASELAAHETSVVDTTGAGDALAAGFIAGGPELALAAAARCVSKLGAMP